jgi:uncharacterized protein
MRAASPVQRRFAMAKRFHVHVTHGSEDPTRATLGLLIAKGIIESGNEVEITLAGDGAVLARAVVAENVHGVGIPPLKELLAFAKEKHVPVYV